jgi:hypothetical protein
LSTLALNVLLDSKCFGDDIDCCTPTAAVNLWMIFEDEIPKGPRLETLDEPLDGGSVG